MKSTNSTTESRILTDAEIIEKVQQKQIDLYELIIRKYNPYLYKVGRSYNYNHQDTEDLMQDTFIDAYRHLGQFQGKAQFKSWLVRIMLNNCYNKRRKLRFKYEVMQEVNEQSDPLFSSGKEDISGSIHNNELKHIIEAALGEIPHMYRIVFSLREINGFNVAETAELLDISESNVKVRLNRAKTMLREKLEKAYSPEELFEFNLIYCDAIVENVMNRIKNPDHNAQD